MLLRIFEIFSLSVSPKSEKLHEGQSYSTSFTVGVRRQEETICLRTDTAYLTLVREIYYQFWRFLATQAVRWPLRKNWDITGCMTTWWRMAFLLVKGYCFTRKISTFRHCISVDLLDNWGFLFHIRIGNCDKKISFLPRLQCYLLFINLDQLKWLFLRFRLDFTKFSPFT